MSEKRIIKKYPNRRLYDTEISKYITLEDIKILVKNGVDFIVKDVKTNEDLTRNILLQIIAEQEHGGEPIFSTQTLTQLIRFYGNSYQKVISDYLQKSMDMFANQKDIFQKDVQESTATNAFTTLNKITEHNLDLWKQMQDNLLKADGMSNPEQNPEDKC